MKRLRKITLFLVRFVAAIIGLIVIAVLGRSAYISAQDLVNSMAIQRQHDAESAVFPTVATQIAFANATLSYERTHAPTDTLVPTDTPDTPDTSDLGNGAPDNSLPTDVPNNPGKLAVAQAGPPSTNTPHPTVTQPVVTDTAAASPTVAATLPPVTPGKLPTVFLFAPSPLKSTQVTAIPSPVPRLKSPNNDIINIALSGTDADVDPTDPSYRTDSLIVVSINRTTNTVSMLSLPRDLYVFIPTLGMQRLNDAFYWGDTVHYQPGGGFGLLQQTVLYNFGIPLHYYARISFNSFKTLVDAINGVDVAVDCPVTDLRYQGPVDQHTPEPSEYTPFTLNTGYYHMNGSLALWYARMRTNSSDFDRSRRQQQVLRAIWKTARSQGLMDLTKLPELWNQFSGLFETDMTLPELVSLAPLALNLQPGDIRSFYMFKGYELQHWTTPKNEDVQLPVPKNFLDTLNRFYTPPAANRLSAAGLSIDVVNSSGHADLDKVAVDRLSWDGFTASANGVSDVASKTMVFDYTGNANPATLNAMLKSLNVKPSVVQSQPDPNRTVDFKVVLGADYNPCSAPGYNNQ